MARREQRARSVVQRDVERQRDRHATCPQQLGPFAEEPQRQLDSRDAAVREHNPLHLWVWLRYPGRVRGDEVERPPTKPTGHVADCDGRRVAAWGRVEVELTPREDRGRQHEVSRDHGPIPTRESDGEITGASTEFDRTLTARRESERGLDEVNGIGADVDALAQNEKPFCSRYVNAEFHLTGYSSALESSYLMLPMCFFTK